MDPWPPDGHFANVLVISYLAFGKEGKVYQAELLDTHQPVAVKCIERWEKQIVSLKKTLDFCRKLEHPNIVRHLCHQACKSMNPLEPPVYQVIMELCKGGTLRQVIRRIVVTPFLLQKWTKEIVDGLAYLHEKHCVHRDLKGENILMTSRNLATSSIKIADLSSIATTDEDFFGHGTYPFMAPEMIIDPNLETDGMMSRRGPSADIWSLGCVVIEMINGTSPQFFREYNGEKVQIIGEHAVLYFVMTGGFPTIPTGLPPDVNHFVRRCLKRDPCIRSTAIELKGHRFLTRGATLSNWVLPKPIGDIRGPVELEEFSLGSLGIVPVQYIRMISHGSGYPKVFQAQRTDTNEIIALKTIILDTDPVLQQTNLRQLQAEFQILSALHHPNIVRHIYQQQAPIASVYDPPTYQILMEYCEGPTLCHFVRKFKIPPLLLQKWTKQLVDAISYLHSQNCIHRNIDNRSIVLSSNDAYTCLVKICGFGMTKHLQGKTAETNEGSFTLSTARYTSPEMITGERLRRTTDIWSLGCVVVEMVTGVYPQYERQGSDWRMHKLIRRTEIINFIGSGGLPTVPECLPGKLKDFVKLCLTLNPDDRPRAADLKRHGFLTANQEEMSGWLLPLRASGCRYPALLSRCRFQK